MRTRQFKSSIQSTHSHALHGAAIAIAATMCGSVFAQSLDIVYLNGTVRDFSRTNTEFNVTPSHGNGHYAGNIDLALGNSDKPAFSGAGHRINNQWEDRDSNPIAPHMYMNGLGQTNKILVSETTTNDTKLTLDSWNSRNGPYGGANSGGAKPAYQTGAPMPTIIVPKSLKNQSNAGNLTYTGTNTISSNIHCDSFTVLGGGSISIDGKVSIYCEDAFMLETNTAITLTPGSRLNVYLGNGASSWNHVEINKNTQRPDYVFIYNLSTSPMYIHNHADVYATIVSPQGPLDINNHGELFGRYIGLRIDAGNHASIHHDTATYSDLCGVDILDTTGTRGPSSSGGIPSASSFDTWYQDKLGSNLSMNHEIGLIRNGSGVYEYMDDAFFPIDGLMFGNQGQNHNYYFTYVLPITFTHSACGDRFFEFQGADDAWLFVDGRLAIDLGGVLANTLQRINFDRLELVDGETYTMHFFYAQRNPSTAMFRLRTNADIHGNAPDSAVSAAFD